MFKFLPTPLYAPDPPGGTVTPPSGDPPPNAPPQGSSLLNGGIDPPPPPDPNAPPAVLPENWRDLMAGEDAGYKEELGRYKSPAEVAKALVEQKKALRTRSVDTEPMPDIGDGKDEAKVVALKTWREKHGVPPEPTGYKIPDAKQKAFGDEDKPALDHFFQWAHKTGKPQAYVEGMLDWYAGYAEEGEALLAENDKKDVTSAEDTLRGSWGPDYRANLDFATKTAKDVLGATSYGGSVFDARLPNGTKLGSIPGFVEGMLKVGRSIFGDGSFVGDEQIKTTESRKAELERWASTNYDEYKEKGGQKEYRAILEAEDRRAANQRR